MIPIAVKPKKKMAIYVTNKNNKGTYPLRRALVIAQTLIDTVDIIFIAEKCVMSELKKFRTIVIDKNFTLLQALKKIQPDLLLRDSGSTQREEVSQLKKIVPSIIHFDDFGEGSLNTDFVFKTLWTETNEETPKHHVIGYSSFIADETLTTFKRVGVKKEKTKQTPHLVVTFGDEDPDNLTYRSLRHLLQLQISLKVTVIVGDQYHHDINELKLMALSRRNTTIKVTPSNTTELLSTADIVLCGAGYMPYEIGVLGIPCIVLAQNEFEMSLSFPKEEHGFIHLGSGRKVKQSNLLNAVMELLLHDSLRQQAVSRQAALNLGDGKDMVCEAILYFLEYPKRPSQTTIEKKEIDMI